MYYTGLDPLTKKPVQTAQHMRDRKLQRALLQFFKPENYFDVCKAIEQVGGRDLIGSGCDRLIPANLPKEAIFSKRKQANDYVHTVSNPAKQKGYRPGRKSAKRQNRRRST